MNDHSIGYRFQRKTNGNGKDRKRQENSNESIITEHKRSKKIPYPSIVSIKYNSSNDRIGAKLRPRKSKEKQKQNERNTIKQTVFGYRISLNSRPYSTRIDQTRIIKFEE